MKHIIAIAASVAAFSPAIFAVSPAHANCKDSVSYVVMPNGCYSLAHFNIVNLNQVNTAQVNQAYRRELRVNAALDNDAATLKFETREERDARYRDLAKQSKQRDKANDQQQEIEVWAYQRQLKILNAVNGVLAPRR